MKANPYPGRVLASYLPMFQVRLIADGRRPRPEPFVEHCSGVILLVDVSGFTELTARFAAKGAAGAEELSGILNGYFGSVADIIAVHGGDIIAFAGDSALAMWPGEDSLIPSNLALAAHAALQIQSELHGYEAAPGVKLRQRAGIACGSLQIMELGGADGRWQFLVTGQPIRQASIANHNATPGEVLLSSAAWSRAQDSLSGEVLPSGFTRVAGAARVELMHSQPAPELSELAAAALHTYLPLVVSDRLRVGQEQWIAEFRNLSVLFINLLQRDPGSDVDALQRGFFCVQETLARFEGTVYQFLMDDKGLTIVCAFGLPPFAHEDNSLRAAEAAMVISQKLAGLGLPSATGVATGNAFCGVYGSDRRRQYTTLGSAVNLAARLMQAAENKIFCDQATFHAAHASGPVQFVPLGSLTLKGWSTPVSVYEPHAIGA